MNVYANYGAGQPVVAFHLKELSRGHATLVDENGGEIMITVSEIRETRPTEGSPIGYYYNELDAI